MTEHDTPHGPAPDAAAPVPDAAPQPETAASTPPAASAQEGLRRWLPRRRPAAAQAAGTSTQSPADEGPPAAPPAAEADAAPAATGSASTDPAPSAERPRRRWGRRRAEAPPAVASPAGDDAAAEPAPVAADTESNPARLRRRRKRLIDDREIAVYHLGGLAFELYRRDLLSEDVLRRRAGAVALIDEAVHDIDERLEQLDSERREKRARRGEGGLTTAGNCLACRAPFQAEARFCWQCGARLIPADPELDAQVTQTIAAQRP